MGPGHGLKDTPESKHSQFCGVRFAGQHCDAGAEPQIGGEIAAIVVAGAFGFMRIRANLRAFLAAVERRLRPFFEGAAHHILHDGAAHAQQGGIYPIPPHRIDYGHSANDR